MSAPIAEVITIVVDTNGNARESKFKPGGSAHGGNGRPLHEVAAGLVFFDLDKLVEYAMERGAEMGDRDKMIRAAARGLRRGTESAHYEDGGGA